MSQRDADVGGMVGGQMLDLIAEHTTFDIGGITRLQRLKTGELIAFAATAGALVTMGQPGRSGSGAKPAQSRAVDPGPSTPNKVHVDAQVPVSGKVPPLPPAGELLRRRPKAHPTVSRQGHELLEPMTTSKIAAAAEAAYLGRRAALIGAIVLFALGALTGAVVGRTATS